VWLHAYCKNGYRRGKQNHICIACRHQFIEHHTLSEYADEVETVLADIVNSMGFRGIEWVTEVPYTTMITLVKQMGKLLPDALEIKLSVRPV
jgi:transposase-like protein